MPYVLTEALKDRCRFRRELGHARWWMPSIDRTIALDSSFTPAYIHASELGLKLNGERVGAVRSHVSRTPSLG